MLTQRRAERERRAREQRNEVMLGRGLLGKRLEMMGCQMVVEWSAVLACDDEVDDGGDERNVTRSCCV